MLEQLVEDLKSADAGVRFYAAQRMGTLDDARAVAPLIDALPDSNAKVQYAVVSSLIKIGASEAVDPILSMLLNDLNSRVWDLLKLGVGLRLRSGLIDMVQRHDQNFSERLAGALDAHSLDEHQRALLVRMIGRTGDARRLDLLVELLESDLPILSVAAAEALGWLGDKRAVPPLIAALDDDSDAIREVAAEALGRIGALEAFDAVLLALNDINEWVRRAAAVALGLFGDRRAIEPLTAALSDEQSMVQDAAFESLKKLSSDHFTTMF